MSQVRFTVSLALVLLLAVPSLSGQGLTGQISGMVHDSTGSAVVGATVTLTNEGTGQTRELLCERGVARSFQITNLFRGLTVYENLRLSVQGRHASRFDAWRDIDRFGDRKKLADYCFRQVWAGVQSANSGRPELLPPLEPVAG